MTRRSSSTFARPRRRAGTRPGPAAWVRSRTGWRSSTPGSGAGRRGAPDRGRVGHAPPRVPEPERGGDDDRRAWRGPSPRRPRRMMMRSGRFREGGRGEFPGGATLPRGGGCGLRCGRDRGRGAARRDRGAAAGRRSGACRAACSAGTAIRPRPITFRSRGSGARIVDSRGRRFIDYSCGGGSLILGYSHPAIVEAVQRQAARSIAVREHPQSLANPPRRALHRHGRLGGPGPFRPVGRRGGDVLVPPRTGLHRAREGAQVRRRLPRELRLRPLERGAGGAGVVDGRVRDGRERRRRCGCGRGGTGAGLGRDPAGESRTSSGRPLQRPRSGAPDRAGGVAVARRGHRRTSATQLRRAPGVPRRPPELCTAYGVALVFDEVVTGFRHARGGAAEVFGVEPDLGAFGKALGGGVPISAVAGREEVMDHADPRRGGAASGYAYVTTSQAGNPPRGGGGPRNLARDSPGPGCSKTCTRAPRPSRRGSGTASGGAGSRRRSSASGRSGIVAFSPRPIFDQRSAARADAARNLRFHVGLIRHGVMVRAGGRSYFSTAHREGEVEETLRAAERALDEL